jgi:hypothetical protein
LLVVLALEIGRGDKAADGMSMLKFCEMRKRRVREGRAVIALDKASPVIGLGHKPLSVRGASNGSALCAAR